MYRCAIGLGGCDCTAYTLTGVHVILFDMDGVISQFVRGALRLHNSTLDHSDITGWAMYEKMGLTEPALYAPMGYDFWSSLDCYSDGFELLGKLLGERLGLLSSPVLTPGCTDGKRAWVKRHLPDLLPRTFIGTDKSLFAHENAILIDDSDANVEKFRLAGGRAVLVPRPWNAARAECDITGHFNARKVFEQIAPLL